MRRILLSFRDWAAAFGGIFLASCLPTDTRPVPGSVNVTVTADPTLLADTTSLSTVDGWTVSYDRFLISLTGTLSGETTCASYYNDGYQRILDMRIAGPQKLNLLYALGQCDFGFKVESADSDPYQPLGKGVTLADKALMGTADLDPYTSDAESTPRPTGIALYAKGRATNGGVTKTFTWSFRQPVAYRNCRAGEKPGDAGQIPKLGVDLASGEATNVDIRIHGESLLLDSTNSATGVPRFDIFRAADDQYGDSNGDVTLTELGQVPLSGIGMPGLYTQPPGIFPISSNVSAWTTLEDFVYLGLYPSVARFEDTGACLMGDQEG